MNLKSAAVLLAGPFANYPLACAVRSCKDQNTRLPPGEQGLAGQKEQYADCNWSARPLLFCQIPHNFEAFPSLVKPVTSRKKNIRMAFSPIYVDAWIESESGKGVGGN